MTGARIEIISMYSHPSPAEVTPDLIMDRGASIGMAGKNGGATYPPLRRPLP